MTFSRSGRKRDLVWICGAPHFGCFAPKRPNSVVLPPRVCHPYTRRPSPFAVYALGSRKALPGLESEAGVKTGLESAGERILRAGLAGAAEAGLAAVAVHDDAQTVILTGTGSVGVDLE